MLYEVWRMWSELNVFTAYMYFVLEKEMKDHETIRYFAEEIYSAYLNFILYINANHVPAYWNPQKQYP